MTDLVQLPLLDETTLDADPVKQFKKWFDDATTAGAPDPDAVVLATATPGGNPSARVVLLKLVDERGFVFHTNYRSRKGRDLEMNPRGALTFFWPGMHRQVRVEGAVSRLPADESDRYFSSRPRDGQLSSWASEQSEPIGNRAELDRRFEELQHLFDGKPVPRPVHWGGYRLQPESIEFWQSRFARLNDRIIYTRHADGKWTRTRLQP